MKVYLLVFTLTCLACLQDARSEEAKYTSKYDNINLDEILNNDRLYKKYFQCIMGEGKCTPDGKELKDNMPDALATDCSKCSEKQRAGAEKVIKFMVENKHDDWIALEKLYDPEGVYRSKYKLEADKKGIKID